MKKIILALLALTLCAMPFLPGIHGPFLLDDTSNLLQARAAKGTLDEIVDVAIRNESGLLRRPVSNLSFLATYHWVGTTAFHYKVVNLAIHALIALLVWLTARRLLRQLYPDAPASGAAGAAWFAAAFWALHPIQVSTVLYAVQRMAQLSTLFVLAALLLTFRLVQAPRGNWTPTRGTGAAATVGAVTLLAVLSKENGALFPLLLLATYLSLPGESRRLYDGDAGRKAFLTLSAWAPSLLGAGYVLYKLPSIAASYAPRDFTIVQRVLTEPFALLHYLETIFVPRITRMGLYLDDIPIRDTDDPLAWLVLAGFALLPVTALLLRQRSPAACFGILWYLGAHAMESTVFPLEIAFEHRNYLALFGPALAVGHYLGRGVDWAIGRTGVPMIRLLALTPFLLLASGTASRAHQWSSMDLFVEHEARNHPLSPRAISGIASREAASGNMAAVAERVALMQRLRPDNFWTHSLDLQLVCFGYDKQVDWEKFHALIRRRPLDVGADEALRSVSNHMRNSGCPGLDRLEFERLLLTATDAFERAGLLRSAERMYILRSYTHRDSGENALVRSLLQSGADVHPTGFEAIEDLAYFELNSGNLDAAEAAIDEMERRTLAQKKFSRMHHVHELRGYLAHARGQRPLPETGSDALPGTQ